MANAIEASRHVGDDDESAIPSDEPKVNKTNDSAAAARAPAITGVHCT
jgi:hypothetical protein